jgi:co-chaperonin GroES (HSP10)
MTLPLILGNRALVEMEGANVTERGGIIISPVASETRGKIVALGDGDKIPTMLKTAVGEPSSLAVTPPTRWRLTARNTN